MPREVVLARYGHTQVSPADTWIVDHKLNVVDPVVDVWVYENGVLYNSDAYSVSFTTPDTVIIIFNSGTQLTGQALIT